jgi:murein DD-endopeptidase MepM/ murein hydrolase activator NlpD
MGVVTTTKAAIFLKKNDKKIFIAAAALVITFFLLPVFMISAFIPGGDEDTLQNYIQTSNDLGIFWQDLVAFDMVFHENELQGRDPNESALYFIELRYEEFKRTEEGEKITKVITADNYKDVKKFFSKYGTGKTLKEKIDSINAQSNKRIFITIKTADEAMAQAKFKAKEIEGFYDIQKSGILQELFPEYQDVGIIPGTCVNNVSPNGMAKTNAAVQSYTETIKKYAKQYGVSEYVEVIKAIMMAESGGSGGDPMQASEGKFAGEFPACSGKSGAARIGCITNPEDSIKAGVQEFKAAIERADYDIAIAIQTYNFGPYFATWIRQNGGKYTVELAQQYSQTVMAAAGQGLGTPTHAQKVLTQFYEDPGCTAGSITPDMVGANDWLWPTGSKRITSLFGPRTKPCSGCSSVHQGLDIGATRPGVPGDPIWATADGVVTKVGSNSTSGNNVYIDHGNAVSMYLHLERYTVQNGQKVSKGQIIGYMGNTGASTAAHLHFEVRVNGTPIDPLPLFPNIR